VSVTNADWIARGYGPKRFVRVTFDPAKIVAADGGAPKPVMLEVTGDRQMKVGAIPVAVLIGYAVDHDGQRMGVLHMIDKASIKRITEYRESLHYGGLERVPAPHSPNPTRFSTPRS
jgi:hypothetical protein